MKNSKLNSMAKDPAVLFYTSDFLTGTSFFTMEQKGQYITLLCQQHQLYSIPKNHMINICRSLDSPVIKKFVKDNDGNYYNKRMRDEAEKRKKYCESRSNNKSGRKKDKKDKSYDKSSDLHMENENENEDIVKNIIHPFETENFLKAWQLFKDFKKQQFKFRYKPIGEQAALKDVDDLSNHNEELAIRIIYQSIKKGWRGLFAIKDSNVKNTDYSDILNYFNEQ